MSNILTSENIMSHNTKNRTNGVGEWKKRNGVWSMDIRPEPFYQNYTASDGVTKLSYCLNEEIGSGQYVFNLWIDVDDVISGGKNVNGGLVVKYKDGTSYDLAKEGGENIGFQHIYYISDDTKEIDSISVYYYTSIAVYYRYDSFIVPISETSFNKTGIINSGFYIENISSIEADSQMSIGKFGVVTNEFIEY